MLKSEFDKHIGKTSSQEEYEIANKAYMVFDDIFPDHVSVANYYSKYGINGIKALLNERKKLEKKMQVALCRQLDDIREYIYNNAFGADDIKDEDEVIRTEVLYSIIDLMAKATETAEFN